MVERRECFHYNASNKFIITKINMNFQILGKIIRFNSQLIPKYDPSLPAISNRYGI